MVYLDYSATTPVLPEVLDSYNKVTEEYFGNPNSLHSLGIKSQELLKSASKQIAELLNIKENEFIYTSGATEANNMALIGAALSYHKYGNRIVVSKMEHPSIYGICKYLEKLGGKIENIISFKLPNQEINRTLIIIKKLKASNNIYPRNYDKILKRPL